MKVTARAIARAFVDVAKTLPPAEQAALADAAASMLVSHGLLKDSRTFPALVERIWRKQEGMVSVRLTTTTGDAGPVKAQLLTIIESSLKRPCSIEERADPSILGGILLSVGDERFDCTLRSSLNTLAHRLTRPIPQSS